MITEAEYLKALDVVRAYERQNAKMLDGFIETCRSEISTRLFNILYSKMHAWKDINSITRIDFIKTQGAGDKVWEEFVKLRGF